MDGFYAMGLTEMPYVDLPVPSVKKFVEDYKERFNVDPNIGAVYGYVAADLDRAGPEERRQGPDRRFVRQPEWRRSRTTRTSLTARQ